MTARLPVISLLFIVLSYRSFAQRMDMNGGGIGISYSQSPTQPFKDTTGGFGYHAVGITVSVPLFGNRNRLKETTIKDSRPHFYEISAHGSFEQLHSTIGFLKEQRNFYTASAGFGVFFYNGSKNIILANLSMGIAGDGLVIKNNNLKYRFSGSFIVNHIHSMSVMYQYGLVFTYAYGRPLPLPVLGIRKKFARTWAFSAILPVALQVSDRLNKQMTLSFSVRPAGNRYQLQNQNDFNTASTTVYMQLRQFELGFLWQYHFAKQFSLGAEAGLLGGGKLKFTEPEDRKAILYQASTKAGARFRLSLRYRLPHKKAGANMPEDDMLRLN